MPANYLAAIRYNVIDRCLRDKNRKWGWEDLAHVIAQELSEFHGIHKLPSRRTVMGDIFAMRSGVLGYIAPIIHSRSEGYQYAHPGFTIHQVALPSGLVSDLKESLHLLLQLTNNEKLVRIHDSLWRIREYLHITSETSFEPAIYFEHSLNEPGQRWLDVIYEYVRKKSPVLIVYKPFNEAVISHVISPAFIKEYNNRWYIFGYHYQMDKIVNLSLDRILDIQPSIREYFLPPDFSHDSWFRNMYGVTRPDNAEPVSIVFRTTALLSDYLDTKPIHPGQQKLETDQAGWSIYSLELYDNYEIRSKLRSFGKDLEVMSGLEEF